MQTFNLTWEGRVNGSREEPYLDIMLMAKGLILPVETVRTIAVARGPDSNMEWCYRIRIRKNSKPETLK